MGMIVAILTIGFENGPVTKFQRVMDQVLDSFAFAKCYINNIIIFSLTKTDDIHHLQEVLGHLKETTFSCILASVSFPNLNGVHGS